MNTELFQGIFEVLTLIICVFYPIWRSYKLLEAKKYDEELILWLVFWLINAFIAKVEDILTSVYLFATEDHY